MSSTCAPRAPHTAPARAAPDEHRLDRDLGVPERRADHGRLDRRSRPRHGPSPLRAAERHDALAGERAPRVARRGEVGPVAPEQLGDERGVARQQVHRAAGSFADEAPRQRAGRVEPCVAREAEGVERRRRALAQQLAQEAAGAPTGAEPHREEQRERHEGKECGTEARAGRHGRQCDGSRGRGEGWGPDRSRYFYTFHRLFPKRRPHTQEPTWPSRS